MINVNMYQYERDIEIACLDGDNTSTMTNYLGNMPMYDGTHKLHKGIDNTLRFKIKDTDRKPIDLTNKTIVWKMYDRESRENVLFKYLTVTNATKGMASLVIQTADTIMLPQGFYQFAMYTVENGVEQIIYTDTYDNAKGAIEVIDDVYPEFEPSQVCENFFDDGNYFISTAFNGSGGTGYFYAISCQHILDVTSTSTHKVKFQFEASHPADLSGNSNYTDTGVSFLRLGDT